MLTRVLTQVYTRVPTKVAFLCIVVPYKGSHSSAHVSAHAGAHASVHEVVWSYVIWSVFTCSVPYPKGKRYLDKRQRYLPNVNVKYFSEFLKNLTFLAGHGEICPHMGDPHGDPQTSPQHADPHGLWCLLKENHTRNPCGSACCGLVCGSPCGSPMWHMGQISPWPARKVTTLRPENITYINFCLRINFPKKKSFQLQEIFSLIKIRKLHITYSFVIQRITWKNSFGIIFSEISFQLHKTMFSELISQ